ncbi:hypothetical protein AURDEDRAFT_131466 [Auricularia subglabra TFB-10046 SS5]|uniref:Uncharacterized protein n=1 Tax=Auricularia subglabra (strain TFB-10046 / SS5) TaxID=717982 RepID=J0CU52_AURST|nr:hypothetical protein AURDEDRAFT_131466 [Auricularia subglabra TFB-10046 SS5]
MSIFEPTTVRAILCAAEPTGKRSEFDSKWDAEVKKRCTAWASAEQKRISRLKVPQDVTAGDDDDSPNALSEQQLRWMAEVLEYVNYIHLPTRVHGNAKSVNQPVLNSTIPLLGPRFVSPPPALSAQAGKLVLRPLNVVHEFYYPDLRSCRVCAADKTQTSSEGWASSVSRRVHGISVEELACPNGLTQRRNRVGNARLAKVTVLFNERLAAEFGQKAVPKDPRAVMSTLSALETAALARLNANNFASQGGSLTFWTKQCSFEFTKRGGDSRNHARDCCTDGANVSYKESASYPQPPGVFLAGKRFNVPAFMGALARLQTIVANNLDKPLEYARFQDMLAHRVQITGGVTYFRCLEGLVHEPQATALEEVDGIRMLRLGEVGDP